jgi:pantoate--beta-alanine ligase
MEIIKTIPEMKDYSKKLRKAHKLIGLVPTMGYLHEGHLSLVKRSCEENDETVVSIFVNPTQFGTGEDIASYPRDLERDSNMLKNYAQVVFTPEAEEMYPKNFSTFINVEHLTENLCGRFRPGHFRGVATVVAKLFNIVSPSKAYFGKKDYQQFRVIERMVKDLNLDIDVVPCEIVREPSGLALSSRNVYLSDREKGDAVVIHRSLVKGKEMIQKGERNPHKIIQHIQELLQSKGSLKKIDYVSVVDSLTLEDVKEISGNVVILTAAYFGRARLIDNIEVNLT